MLLNLENIDNFYIKLSYSFGTKYLPGSSCIGSILLWKNDIHNITTQPINAW